MTRNSTQAIIGLAFLSVGPGAVAAAADGFDPRDYQAIVAPFLQKHCTGCHGAQKQESNLRLDNLDSAFIKGRDIQTWNNVRVQLLAGDMPPASRPRPPVQDLQRVVDWLTAGLKVNGTVTLRQPPDFNHPRFGNRVDHAALFQPRGGVFASSPPRIWRLSSFGYTGLTSGLISLGGGGKNKSSAIIQPFGTGGLSFSDYAALLQIDEPTINQLLRNAATIVEFQSTASPRRPSANMAQPSKVLIALAQGIEAPTRGEMEAGIREQFQIVLQRPPTAGELADFSALMEKNIQSAGRTTGVRTALMAVLLQPEALYRVELGDGQRDAHGRSRLTPQEIAAALSYALTDQRPDATLRAAAEQGQLATAEGVRREVRRLLDDAQFKKPRILRFFHEYFGYHRAPEVFKNDSDNRDHGPMVLVSDTDLLVESILACDQNVLYELLTTRKSFVGWEQKPGLRRDFAASVRLKGNAASSYNLSVRPDDAAQPVELPADQRMGILTQPSWLVAYSENTDNHAILRGKWIRERLLGGTVPDLPITVNAMLPDEPHRSLRDRMSVTREKYCWQCHQKMDPLGLAFEMYDHFGRFRTTEAVVDPGKPVVKGVVPRREVALDSSGVIAESGDSKLEGEVPNALKLIEKLAASERVRQVFVRHAFRYWLGRNETLDDGPTLIAADRAYVESGGSMKALIAGLLSSDSFLYRKAP